MSIDLDIIFAVVTFGCILFVLQTLVEYNKRASAIRPQLNEVKRIKDKHKEEMGILQIQMDESEKEASKVLDEIAELETKHDELELKADQLRQKVQANKDF